MPLNVFRSMYFHSANEKRDYSKRQKSGFSTKIAIGFSLLRISVETLQLYPDYVRDYCAGRKRNSRVILFKRKRDADQRDPSHESSRKLEHELTDVKLAGLYIQATNFRNRTIPKGALKLASKIPIAAFFSTASRKIAWAGSGLK